MTKIVSTCTRTPRSLLCDSSKDADWESGIPLCGVDKGRGPAYTRSRRCDFLVRLRNIEKLSKIPLRLCTVNYKYLWFISPISSFKLQTFATKVNNKMFLCFKIHVNLPGAITSNYIYNIVLNRFLHKRILAILAKLEALEINFIYIQVFKVVLDYLIIYRVSGLNML